MSLKKAIHQTVAGYPGGTEALAPQIGCGASTLRSKANPNLNTHHLSVEEADKLMRITGDLAILHTLAAQQNHVAVPIAEGNLADMQEMAVFSMMAKVFTGSGDVAKVIEEIWADKKVEHHELPKLRKSIYEAQAVLTAVLQKIEGAAQ
jgi:hypothetical protein